MNLFFTRGLRGACLATLVLPVPVSHATDMQAELTLATSEQLALSADPAVTAREARALALQDQAVADGQLPDPKLLVGVTKARAALRESKGRFEKGAAYICSIFAIGC